LKPFAKREFSRLKDGAANHRGLHPAVGTLKMLECLVPNDRMSGFAALGAVKPVGPAHFFKFCFTLLLGAVISDKLTHGEPFLELHLVDGHGSLPGKTCQNTTTLEGQNLSIWRIRLKHDTNQEKLFDHPRKPW